MTLSKSNLITEPILRRQRSNEKQYLVLRFLREVLWSSQDVLQHVMKLQSRQSAHKSLKQMESLGLIKHHVYDALGGRLTLWGITQHGQMLAFNLGEETAYSSYFEPSRVSEQLIRHQLDLHQLRISAEASGWSQWRDGDRLGKLSKNVKRPDAIAFNSKHGVIVGVECERSFKTQKRYQEILLSYLRLLRDQKLQEVVWVSPTDDFAKRLEVLIKSIKQIRSGGQATTIDLQKYHKYLHFCSYKNWPDYE